MMEKLTGDRIETLDLAGVAVFVWEQAKSQKMGLDSLRMSRYRRYQRRIGLLLTLKIR
jgi:hypothetical protein